MTKRRARSSSPTRLVDVRVNQAMLTALRRQCRREGLARWHTPDPTRHQRAWRLSVTNMLCLEMAMKAYLASAPHTYAWGLEETVTPKRRRAA
jgi:hypothetical protein